ncbi:MAG: class III extradiol ring-cleavage dioxygenase [Actinomycetota bacterium]|nr:class III extradiol ring-cleavage dioxygenase [Actinomycetota bacterium]
MATNLHGASATAAADALVPPEHPFRRHLQNVEALEAVNPHRPWVPEDGALPALYLSHGAPPTFEDPEWMSELHGWARSFPKPRSILIVSAHWEAAPLMVSAGEPTELVYDFGGFAAMYYRMRYDTPPGTDLIRRLAGALGAGESLHEHRRRGLDHGAWVPLKIMYPAADVPVVQLSLPSDDPERLVALGGRLRALREEGTLVIGSGFMTHGLQFVTQEMLLGAVPGWSSEFDAWAASALERGDVEELSRFRTVAPALRFAHPTVEHFTPIFVTLGAASDPSAPVETTIDGYMIGLSKRSFQAR